MIFMKLLLALANDSLSVGCVSLNYGQVCEGEFGLRHSLFSTRPLPYRQGVFVCATCTSEVAGIETGVTNSIVDIGDGSLVINLTRNRLGVFINLDCPV